MFIGIAEAREDFAMQAKIGMVHVFRFDGARQRERQLPKIVYGHWHKFMEG
jgi:hypothetical protein